MGETIYGIRWTRADGRSGWWTREVQGFFGIGLTGEGPYGRAWVSSQESARRTVESRPAREGLTLFVAVSERESVAEHQERLTRAHSLGHGLEWIFSGLVGDFTESALAAVDRLEAFGWKWEPKDVTGKQPPRGPEDGPVNISRVGVGDGHLVIEATQGGEATSVRMSEYNAWRVFGSLALMLGISLPAKIGKEIKL